MSSVDQELKKLFEELQIQVLETRSKMRQIDVQIEVLKRSCQHSNLTRKEVTTIPIGTNTYESVGRMFVKRDIPQVTSMLEEKVKKSEEKIQGLEGSKSYLEASLKERENNLRELVAHKQQKLLMEAK